MNELNATYAAAAVGYVSSWLADRGSTHLTTVGNEVSQEGIRAIESLVARLYAHMRVALEPGEPSLELLAQLPDDPVLQGDLARKISDRAEEDPVFGRDLRRALSALRDAGGQRYLGATGGLERIKNVVDSPGYGARISHFDQIVGQGAVATITGNITLNRAKAAPLPEDLATYPAIFKMIMIIGGVIAAIGALQFIFGGMSTGQQHAGAHHAIPISALNGWMMGAVGSGIFILGSVLGGIFRK